MVALGIEPQENIGIFSQNKPECLFTDFGAFANRAVTIPLYATSSPAQAQYIINDAQIRYLFVGEQFQYDAAFSVFGFCQSLQQLIIFDRAVVKDPRDMTSIYFDEFMAMDEELQHNAIVEERNSSCLTMMTSPISFILPVLPVSRKVSCSIISIIERLPAFMISDCLS